MKTFIIKHLGNIHRAWLWFWLWVGRIWFWRGLALAVCAWWILTHRFEFRIVNEEGPRSTVYRIDHWRADVVTARGLTPRWHPIGRRKNDAELIEEFLTSP